MTKVSKASVNYRPADLPDVRCGTCVMYHPDHTCDLVAGSIDPQAVCDRWEPRRTLTSGNARENIAAAVALAVAVIFLAAEMAILAAIAYWVGRVVTGGLLANLGLRRLRQAAAVILYQADEQARTVLGDGAKATRADAERVIRDDLAAIGFPAGGEPPGPLAPGRLRPPGISPTLISRITAELLGRPAPAEWRGLPALLHDAGLNVLRETDDIYRQVIADAMAAPSGSRLERAQIALDGFAERGITAFTDSAGRRWDIAAYVEMATRTAASRLHLALQLGAMGPAGTDLVIVVHPPQLPPCPKCLPYIGRVLSVSGMTPTGIEVSVTRADGVPQTAEVMTSLADARAHGWGHPACRCSLMPFADGAAILPLSGTAQAYLDHGKRATEPVPPPDATRRYQAEQALRGHERAIRRERRLQAAAVSAKARRQARSRIARATARLEEHVRRTGATRSRRREQIKRPR